MATAGVTGAAPTDGSSPSLPRWRVFPAIAIGTLMATLDISVVNVALPTLSRSFHAPLTDIEWVVLSYVTTITGLLLLCGRIADRLGRRRVYSAGLVAFTAASALCAAAPGLWWLVAARTLQGVGAAMMTANGAALLVSSFPPGERGRALGAFGAAVGVGLALGPALGGTIVGYTSWRWIFILNLPLGLLAMNLVQRRVAADGPAPGGAPIDVAGAALGFGTIATLVLGLARGPAAGWGSPAVWAWFVAALVLGVLFAARERRAVEPLVPLALLRGPLAVAATLTLVGQALSLAVGFHLPLYLENVMGFDPARAGRWLALLPLAALALAPVAGRMADRVGSRPLTAGGLLIAATGLAVLAGFGPGAETTHLLAGMALVGVGMGVFSVPNASALLGSVPPHQLGLASGLQGTMRNLGMTGGAALTAAVMASRYAAHGGGTLAAGQTHEVARAAFAAATRELYGGTAVTAALAALLALGSAERGRAGPGAG